MNEVAYCKQCPIFHQVIWDLKTLTRRFPELLSQWVLDSGIASAQWMLNPQHLGCRTLFLSCFYSWQNLQSLLSEHPKMSSVHTKTDTQWNILEFKVYTTIAAEKTTWKVKNQKKILAPKKRRLAGEKTLSNFTLEASAAVPYLTKSANTPGWKIWYHQQWWQKSRPQGGLLHHTKHDSQSDSVTLEYQAWW